MTTTLKVGETISWKSAAGKFEGKITKIFPGKNANNEVINWMIVEYVNNNDKKQSVRMAMNSKYYAMMNIKKVTIAAEDLLGDLCVLQYIVDNYPDDCPTDKIKTVAEEIMKKFDGIDISPEMMLDKICEKYGV